MESLKDKTAKGLLWGGVSNSIQQLFGFLFGIIMARLLLPEYFGLVAMITVFSAVANTMQNSGFSTALINEKKQKESNFNAVFWFNIVMGVAIYFILFICAPLIADYYKEPRLTWLCRYAFLSFVFSSWGVAQAAYLYKNLRTKQLAQANIIAVLLSGSIAVVMAWQGFTYWSIATQTNLFILISTLLRWHYSEWRPSLTDDFSFIKRSFPFSVKILLSEILTQINNNVMNILLGHFFGSIHTGQYNQAYQWNYKGYSLVQNMVKQVDQAVLVSLADERERQLAVLRKMIRFGAFVSFPLLLGVGLVAKEFIVLALGEIWLKSAGYLQIICIAGSFIPTSTLLADLIISKGRSDIFMWCTLALGVSQIAALLLLHPHGILAMVYAYTALTLLWVFVFHFFVWKLTGYTFLMLFKDTLPFALSAATVMVTTGLLTQNIHNLWILLAIKIIVSSGFYYLIMRLFHVTILEDCIRFIKERKGHSLVSKDNSTGR